MNTTIAPGKAIRITVNNYDPYVITHHTAITFDIGKLLHDLIQWRHLRCEFKAIQFVPDQADATGHGFDTFDKEHIWEGMAELLNDDGKPIDSASLYIIREDAPTIFSPANYKV